MNKENVLFGVVGLLAGLIVGFMFANSVNQGAITGTSAPNAMKANSNMPPDHPAIPPGTTMPGGAKGELSPEGLASIEKAKQSPADFDAQIKAAEAYYQADDLATAIVYLTAANKIKPDEREVIVHLGNANFDTDKYEEAEKWYNMALAKKADDINVRTDLGLTFMFRKAPNYDRAIQEFSRSLEVDPNHVQTLQNLAVAFTKKGDTAKANATVAKLEGLHPKNTSLAKLKDDIQKIGSK